AMSSHNFDQGSVSADTALNVMPQTDEEREVQERAAAEVAAQYDAEAQTRTIKWRTLTLLITSVASFLAVYHMWTAYFGTPPTLIHRSIHVSAILFLIFLLYPPFKKAQGRDRKSTRLNSSHVSISYAVFCLKKK